MTKDYLPLYLELGLAPIPLKGKLPLTRWKDYRYNALDFAKPGINIGIKAGLLPSGSFLFFVDVDDKNLIGELYEKHPILMCAPLVSTARGFHLWLTHREPVKTRVFNKMEIRGQGAYCVAPSSIHPSGHEYKFLIPLRGTPPLYNPLLLSAQSPPSKQIVQNDGRARPVWGPGDSQFAGVKKGQRHNALITLLGALHKACFPVEEAFTQAMVWNQSNHPPLTRAEVVATVQSCWQSWDEYKPPKSWNLE